VEDYLETCKALGREPQKVYKEALRTGVSLNSYVRLALSRSVGV